ncbi:MAG: hypothetical protein NBV68_13795 [Erythrobacter sp.]|nr:hypothetical protein [Erythrobacter sp.]
MLATAFTTPAEEYSQCIDETITNAAWQACGEAYLKRLDGELNAAWARFDAEQRKDLLAEQRA